MHILTCFVNLWLNLFWSLDVISKPSHFRNKVNGHKIWQMSVCLCVWRFPRSELPSAQQRLLVFPTEKKKKNSSSFSYKHSNLHTYLWVCYVTSPKTGSHKIQKKKKTSKHYPPQAWQSAASGMNSICENKRWIINLDDADLTVPSSSVGGFVFVPKGHLNPTKSQSSALYNVKRCKTACFSASLS